MAEVTCRVADGVAVLEIRHPPVNALSHSVRRELQAHLHRLASDLQVGGIVLTGSEGRFIAGADIHEFETGAYLEAPTIRDLQRQLEDSEKPVVAAINGAALGGGLELAMACHWRIASRTSRVGLPEVKLGLIPGSGGTQRFPRLAGPQAALQYITSGEHIPAARALELGLLDETAEDAVAAATTLAQRVWREGRQLRVVSALSDRINDVSLELFSAFRRRMERKWRGQLAPWKIADCIEAACTLPREEAFRFERASFMECHQSPQHKALVHLFFAEREARRIPGLAGNIEPLPVRSVGIIGAGTMGSGIAMVFANARIPVALLELSKDALERGMELIRRNYAASVERGSVTHKSAQESQSLIAGITDYAALADRDLIIEAVFEDLEVKKQVFARLSEVAAAKAILATNTSALDVDAIAAAAAHPERVIGLHFFSPAQVMKLLEVVRGKRSAAQALATAMALARRVGKVAVLAGNCDGFIGNRMWQFYTCGSRIPAGRGGDAGAD